VILTILITCILLCDFASFITILKHYD
jgi:hypothetical protein